MTQSKKSYIFNFISTALILVLLGFSASFVKKNFDQSTSDFCFEIEQENSDLEDDNEIELGLNFDQNNKKTFAKILTKISNDNSLQKLPSSVPTSPPNC